MRRAAAVALMALAGWCVIEGLRLGAGGIGLWRATGERIAADAEAFLDDVAAVPRSTQEDDRA